MTASHVAESAAHSEQDHHTDAQILCDAVDVLSNTGPGRIDGGLDVLQPLPMASPAPLRLVTSLVQDSNAAPSRPPLFLLYASLLVSNPRDEAKASDHRPRPTALDDIAADVLVAAHHGVHHRRDGDLERLQALGVDVELVLPDSATNARHLGDSGHGIELIPDVHQGQDTA